MLSKRRVDAVKEWHKIVEAEKTGEILEGVVNNVVKGGVIAVTNGIRIFIPASMLPPPVWGTSPAAQPESAFQDYRDQPGKAPRRRFGKEVAREERRQKEEAFWAAAAVGQQYTES